MKAFGHLRQRTVMDRNLAFEDLDYVRGIFMSGLADKVHPILSFFNLADNISCGADCTILSFRFIRSFLCTMPADSDIVTFIQNKAYAEFILMVHRIKLQYIGTIGVKM